VYELAGGEAVLNVRRAVVEVLNDDVFFARYQLSVHFVSPDIPDTAGARNQMCRAAGSTSHFILVQARPISTKSQRL
jgi:hypothetical protein